MTTRKAMGPTCQEPDAPGRSAKRMRKATARNPTAMSTSQRRSVTIPASPIANPAPPTQALRTKNRLIRPTSVDLAERDAPAALVQDLRGFLDQRVGCDGTARVAAVMDGDSIGRRRRVLRVALGQPVHDGIAPRLAVPALGGKPGQLIAHRGPRYLGDPAQRRPGPAA